MSEMAYTTLVDTPYSAAIVHGRGAKVDIIRGVDGCEGGWLCLQAMSTAGNRLRKFFQMQNRFWKRLPEPLLQ